MSCSSGGSYSVLHFVQILPHESLGDDAFERGRHEERLEPEVEHAGDADGASFVWSVEKTR